MNTIQDIVASLRERTWLSPVSAEEMNRRDRWLADTISAAVFPTARQDDGTGYGATSEVLAWLNAEQKDATRWGYSATGVYRFQLTGPELMRIRHALEGVAAALPHAPSPQEGERYCICADPWNCKETVPGYICRKGTVPAPSPPTGWQPAVELALSALETGATYDQRKAAFNALRDVFYPLPAPVAPHEDTKK